SGSDPVEPAGVSSAEFQTAGGTPTGPTAGTAVLLNRFESELQVVDQIAHAFHPDRQSHQRIGDSKFLALVFRNRGVGHDRGMINQALDPAQTFGQSK